MHSLIPNFTYGFVSPSNVLTVSESVPSFSEGLRKIEEFCLCDLRNGLIQSGPVLGETNNEYLVPSAYEMYPPLNELVQDSYESPHVGMDHGYRFSQSMQTPALINPSFASYDVQVDFHKASFKQAEAAGLSGMNNLTVLGADNQGVEFSGQFPGKRLSNLTKSKFNMKLLQDYNCSIEKRTNSKGGVTTVYICRYDNCNKEFTRTWSIIDHVRMHEGVRPYKCKYCDRSYTQKGNMLKHMRRHVNPSVNNRRSYTCQFCNKKYTEKYNLKTHQKKFHANEVRLASLTAKDL